MKLVDTSAWVEFLRRKGDAKVKHSVARLLQADEAAYTCPVRFELLSGAKPDEEDDLEQALALAQNYQFEPDDWRQAALLERRLRAKGLTIPRNDLFVAVVAIRARMPVVCRDKHFDAIKMIVSELKVEQA
ncbi:MAG: PIN domain-containing protein [Verrucomicrobiales bacterium]|nr:PIN domain-containing protein [Verrucomicrobiales bacterium]